MVCPSGGLSYSNNSQKILKPLLPFKRCDWWVANYTLLRPIDAIVAETLFTSWADRATLATCGAYYAPALIMHLRLFIHKGYFIAWFLDLIYNNYDYKRWPVQCLFKIFNFLWRRGNFSEIQVPHIFFFFFISYVGELWT